MKRRIVLGHIVNDDNLMISQSQSPSWGFEMLGISDIHKAGFKGDGIKIAVIDTAVDVNHPDLDRTRIKILNATGEPIGRKYNGHGTSTCSIIAAKDDTNGVIGVAPNAQIIAIKGLQRDGTGSLTVVANAVKMAINEGVDIINMSLSSSYITKLLKAQVERALKKGIIVICSSGNTGKDNNVQFPAALPGTIAVGSINRSRRVSSFTSKGDSINISAPGELITVAYRKGGYGKMSGTSFSAPFVTGIVALLLQAKGKMTPAEVMKLVTETAEDILDDGWDASSGSGIIDAKKLVLSESTEDLNGFEKSIVKLIHQLESLGTINVSNIKKSI